jgi:hypothetical protein
LYSIGLIASAFAGSTTSDSNTNASSCVWDLKNGWYPRNERLEMGISSAPHADDEIFILEGVITVAIGLLAPFFLVDFPDKAKFLKPPEKEHVINRLNIERGDGETHNLTWKAFRSHISDWTLWWISLVYLCNVGPIYSLAYFVPTILNVILLLHELI